MFRDIDYDPDDPPPVPTWMDACWHVTNRSAENLLRIVRSWAGPGLDYPDPMLRRVLALHNPAR